MRMTVIDTLNVTNRLKEAGFEPAHAEGMARVLDEELTPQIVTPTILRDELRPIRNRLDRLEVGQAALDAKIDAHGERLDAKIDALGERLDAKIDTLGERLDARIDALDAKLDSRCAGLDARIDALDAKLDARIDALDAKLDARIDALDAKLDAKIDALDSKVEASHRELDAKIGALDGKLNVLTGAMALGFTVLIALGLYNALPREDGSSTPAAAVAQESPATAEAAP